MNVNVSTIYKFISLIKTFFWRDKNIIYVNSNKKSQSKDIIDNLISTRGCKWIMCESITKLGYRFYKLHLLKMKKNLYDISRNLSESKILSYSGFASPMFAAYDGYCLGDNRSYRFIDIDSSCTNGYVIEYEKKLLEVSEFDKVRNDIVNVIFSCSIDIRLESIKGQKYIFDEKSGCKVDLLYLQKVYSYTKCLLDYLGKSGVKRINMYIAAKQPISFIIGTAIQPGHPKVYIYEYFEGTYNNDIPLLIQEGKIGGNNG